MAKKQITDVETDRDEIVFWTFWHRHRPDVKSWHITCNESGANAIRQALLAISPERNAVKNFLTTDTLDAVKIAGNKRRAVLVKNLTFRYTCDAKEAFSITESNDNAVIEFGEIYRAKLIEGMDDILREHGGYAIGEENIELWFWWWSLKN